MSKVIEARGHFEISVSDTPYTEELKGFPQVYHVKNMVNDVVEFEACHYFNCLRYIHDASLQEAAWNKQLDVTLVKLAEEMDADMSAGDDDSLDDYILPDSFVEDDEFPPAG